MAFYSPGYIFIISELLFFLNTFFNFSIIIVANSDFFCKGPPEVQNHEFWHVSIHFFSMNFKEVTRGATKTIFKIEEVSDIERRLIQALEIEDLHNNRPKIKGVSVYN